MSSCIPKDTIKILVCSGNLGNAEPNKESIEEWIPSEGCIDEVILKSQYPVDTDFVETNNFNEKKVSFNTSDNKIDIIVIGMQESTFQTQSNKKNIFDRSTHNIVSPIISSTRSLRNLKKKQQKELTDKVGAKTLCGLIISQCGDSYITLINYERGQMRIMVLIRDTLKGNIEEVRCCAENTGIGGVINNKGGIVASIQLCKTRISFLTAHLEAHEGEAHYRNRCSDLEEILEGTKAKYHDASVNSHVMFVFGDLNYRLRVTDGFDAKEGAIDKDDRFKKVHGLIKDKDWKELNKLDELKTAVDMKDCLAGFKTLPCNFPPTFKVERGAAFVYQTKRIPSFTDRILWKCVFGMEDFVKPILYEPIELFTTSDHKPIRGMFEVQLNESLNKVVNKSVGSLRSSIMLKKSKSLRKYDVLVSNMSCTNLPAMNKVNASSDPYLLFVTSPKRLLQKKGKTLFRKKQEKKDGIKSRSNGWPRGRKINSTLNPDWEDDEIRLKLQHTDDDMRGAMLFITVFDFDHLLRLDVVIGTVVINLNAIQEKGIKSSASNNKCTISIDQPLMKFGKENGRLKCRLSLG